MLLKIFRAADAFLYLPTYIAEEFDIFETLLKPYGIDKFQFITSSRGDFEAIKLMLEENMNTHDSMAIAITDPTAFLSTRIPHHDSHHINDVRVIGAIINKLPFWAVNHVDRVFDSLYDFNSEFTRIIHYKEELITGYYLGNKVKNYSRIGVSDKVDFGEEIPLLLKYDGNIDNKAVAITADIINLVKGMSNPISPLKINYRFSQEGDFITTGVLTSKNCCKKNEKQLNKIVEAIQKSISMLYSSEKIAENICTIVSEKPKFNKSELRIKDIAKIIELINEERFYPADLNIEKESWDKAVKALAKTEMWDMELEIDTVNNSYNKYVSNEYILNSEKSIAKQFGINLATFKEEIYDNVEKPLLKKINLLETDNQNLNNVIDSFSKCKSNFWVKLNLIRKKFFNLYTLYVLSAIIIIFGLIYAPKFIDETIGFKDMYYPILTLVIGIIVTPLIPKILKKIRQKNDKI